ncbi:glycogen debranching N-terminal domain-containing protein [Sphingomicrobium astaxanthinifaciens]|uniref:amylo-alpha-1,6-glucosidase n=1 Tax=Sphingomicrobium astaxanthinifaciens TaxID=1227949 RepID=UPI001FCA557D|nr:glycogen debranching N-terminal domain-containing protein [Sphingomicrobium astaxanthinifaciens]MCJ7420529.1 amylo-alpha-1,6-glucosidase [Sphingomicrobium astaxanthinifaciens]
MNDADFEQLDYHVEATASLVDQPLRTLKSGDVFAIFDQQGNFHGGADGLFFLDTRFLSRYQLRIAGSEPLHLGAVVSDDDIVMVVDLTNADVGSGSSRHPWLHSDTLHISRMKLIRDQVAYERLHIRSYNPIGRPVPVEVRFDADFADLFEVRGARRDRRGKRRVRVEKNAVRMQYRGLDAILRETVLTFSPPPDRLDKNAVQWDLDFDEANEIVLEIAIGCRLGDQEATERSFDEALALCRGEQQEFERYWPSIEGDDTDFNRLTKRSASDLRMLASETEHGWYPYAGIPWYSTVFGRDGIITAMQSLWLAPEFARGVLITLAATQASEIDASADSEPGKILHETRSGEMARLGEVPFRRYYGTVDATPLYVWLAALYYERTGDLRTIEVIWPNILSAIDWMEEFGDVDGDGFIEYSRAKDSGLSNQGWKDSGDAIFHDDGRLAIGPIALCEVQGYAFAAFKGAAALAEVFGDTDRSTTLRKRAADLRETFEEAFWLDGLGTYALALDGQKRPCTVVSSNAGQCLATGIVSRDRADRVAATLFDENSFTGWGIRTIRCEEARYNPMSYHNGSIWPHDNSLIAWGLSRYGHQDKAARLLTSMVDVARYDENRRLPELFCGFSREPGRGPTSYPVACSPQAWAAAAPFAMLKASLGLNIDCLTNRITLQRPTLPDFLTELHINRITVGESLVSLRIRRSAESVTCSASRHRGETEVVIFH